MSAGTRAPERPALIITTHAAERYQQRVKPHLNVEQARWELEQLAAGAGSPTPYPPAWLEHVDPAQQWLEISDGIALAMTDTGYVKTVFVRGGLSEPARKARQRIKKRRRRR